MTQAEKNGEITPGHIFYMRKAYEQALRAYGLDETPVGCVIVYENQIIGAGCNLRNSKKSALHHAELTAIGEACAHMGDWRLEGCTLYVTVEPCPMCAGAIVQSRITEAVFGVRNKKAGCGGSVLNILQEPAFNHQVRITAGVMAEECGELMTRFFRRFRKTAASCNRGPVLL